MYSAIEKKLQFYMIQILPTKNILQYSNLIREHIMFSIKIF